MEKGDNRTRMIHCTTEVKQILQTDNMFLAIRSAKALLFKKPLIFLIIRLFAIRTPMATGAVTLYPLKLRKQCMMQ